MAYAIKIIGVIIFVVLLTVILLAKKGTLSTSFPTKETALAQTELSFSPATLTLPYASGKANIVINTGTNTVQFVQVQLNYDPQKIYDVQFTKGPFLEKADTLHDRIDQQKGTATYILNIPTTKSGVRGKGEIVSISFKTFLVNKQSTTISFSPDTLVTDTKTPGSILKKTSSLKIIRKDK